MAFARSQVQPADENASHQRELKALGIAKAGPAAGNQRRYASRLPSVASYRMFCKLNSFHNAKFNWYEGEALLLGM